MTVITSQNINGVMFGHNTRGKIYQEIYEAMKLDAKYEVEDLTTIYVRRTSDKRIDPGLFLNEEDQTFFTEYIQKE